jgi:hypothetical protein
MIVLQDDIGYIALKPGFLIPYGIKTTFLTENS